MFLGLGNQNSFLLPDKGGRVPFAEESPAQTLGTWNGLPMKQERKMATTSTRTNWDWWFVNQYSLGFIHPNWCGRCPTAWPRSLYRLYGTPPPAQVYWGAFPVEARSKAACSISECLVPTEAGFVHQASHEQRPSSIAFWLRCPTTARGLPHFSPEGSPGTSKARNKRRPLCPGLFLDFSPMGCLLASL